MKQRRAVVQVILFLVPFLLGGLGTYAFLSLKAGRSLSGSEMQRYAGTVGFGTFGFFLETGKISGFRTLGVIADALSDHAISQTIIESGQEKQVLPLPPQTILANCDRIVASIEPIESDGANNPQGIQVPRSCKTGAEYPTEGKFFLTLTPWQEVDQQYLKVILPQSG